MNDIERDSGQSQEIKDFFALNRTITEIEDSIGVHGVIGFEYSFTKSWILNGDVLLSTTEADAKVRYPDAKVRDTTITMNSFVLGLGLKYRY
ncbi:MAG: OmpW family outer membrane protein [bacterium]|nr:OmpW family outer membrane protein [bacterium]